MFVIDDATGELSPLQESAYGSESELQELIARYPQILNGADGMVVVRMRSCDESTASPTT